MTFRERLQESRVVIFDGAMGTQIQGMHITDEEWAGVAGCNEILNFTAPDKIASIHAAYFAAGAEVVETNTFGASRIVLAEYGLEEETRAINRAAAEIARRAAAAAAGAKPRFVAGSIGPGTRLISLGQTSFSALHASCLEQALGLIEGGADLLLIETCQDLLQIKTALIACRDAMTRLGRDLPLAVSVTVETTGTLLVGSEISAVLAALAPFEIDILGLNCATGPEAMRPYIREICQQFPGAVLCQPNAGLPQNVNGEMLYTLAPEEFVHHLGAMVREEGVQLVGGCCGTHPGFIGLLAAELAEVSPSARRAQPAPALSSLFSGVTLRQEPAPFFVGERANTNGSKIFRDFLLAGDWDGMVSVGIEQQRSGAHGIDLCIAYTGRDEIADMREAVSRYAVSVQLPLFIDSTDVRVLEEALQRCGGRAVINSINLEEGEGRADRICALAKRYGAALIALTIDEQGMALEVERKLAVARRLYDIAVGRHGLRPQDLIFDPLTFTLGSGDASLTTAGLSTLEGVRRIKEELPGVYTLLGVSNISFGLAAQAREILNSVFLAEAVKAGLDLAIVNVKKIIPLYQIAPEDLEIAMNLVYTRGGGDPLLAFIDHFDKKAGVSKEEEGDESLLPLGERIQNRIIQGNRSGLEPMLMEALRSQSALEIINTLLIPAMKHVGDLFGSGRMQLPFVLQSAEVMKFAVDKLQPFMDKSAEQARNAIVLATVRGDVHDIGKNLVDIILTNNGYTVYNLGIKCEIDTMIQKALEVKADAIGMSGLLVKSTVVMKENLEELQRRGLRLPVLLGGAALTRSYVEEICSPLYDAPVVYCADAFEGLTAMGRIQEKSLTKAAAREPRAARSAAADAPAVISAAIRRDVEIPVPPFWGDRIAGGIDLETVFGYLTENVLFRGRWGYRRGKLSTEEYQALLEEQVKPEFRALKERCIAEKLLEPKVVYGYYPCSSRGEEVILYHPESSQEWLRFAFPRESRPPHRCIADYFQPEDSGKRDLIALQVVTVGARASEEAKRLYENNAYKEYLLFHGLSVESAEALAEYWHQLIRRELGIADEDGASIEDFVVQKYRGSRYSFGYPACPDLSENRKLFTILRPERIGVTITDGELMTPEQSTSAFIVHHPQAKYFNVA
ncbi:MAG TPA: methionine synthase [bacterium]|nr:methionine synthase [bacterium]